ncbi:MAG: response regulator [Oligoflexia bacterium]|nr:response regulator [Oligoflexia bacterium]
MAKKVLIADDSLTIQKVIGITLANGDYELVSAHSESELQSAIENDNFDLVLLDFKLSDSKTGYDLAKEIRGKNNDSRVIVMLGTFDSVEDQELESAGISDKVIKPFESAKFIEKCENALAGDAVDFEPGESSGLESLTDEDATSEWVLDSSAMQSDDSSTSSDSEESVGLELESEAANPLQAEVEGWGIEVPGVIGAQNENGEIPPVIDGETPQSVSADQENEALPSDDDLDFPDDPESIDFGNQNTFDQATQPTMESSTDDMSLSIESEKSSDDFWAVDEDTPQEFSGSEEPAEQSDTPRLELNELADVDPEESFSLEEEMTEETISEVTTAEPKMLQSEFNIEGILEQLRPMIEQMVEEAIEKKLNDKAESVAWEVIPDLAENLIKKEIESLSSQVRK